MNPNKSKVNGATDQNTNHKDNSINDVQEEEMKSKGKGIKCKDSDFMNIERFSKVGDIHFPSVFVV